MGSNGRNSDDTIEEYCSFDCIHDAHSPNRAQLGLSTGILIAPQRQTGVIAKQAAEADLLSGGRLRLGIGLGWNHVEYEALGMEGRKTPMISVVEIGYVRRSEFFRVLLFRVDFAAPFQTFPVFLVFWRSRAGRHIIRHATCPGWNHFSDSSAAAGA
jgi:alkanesulfonate monooxygenase SsuD/methylene tetrahydromethanopterin reductase-like flavin-dependent oxidoreductase (luciferase family)